MSLNKHKIVFIGGQKIASKIFELFMCSDNIEIGKVFELELDSHEINNFQCIKEKINLNNINTQYKNTKRLSSLDIKAIQDYRPDFIFVINWRTIIGSEILNIPNCKCIGIHSSDLPTYRGFAPVNWAIINGETTIGSSVFFLEKEVDTGDIIEKKLIDVGVDDNINSIMRQVERNYLEMFKNILSDLPNIYGEVQVGEATYTCKRRPQDGYIDFNKQTATEVHNMIRGLSYPYPMAFCKINNKFLFINKSQIVDSKKYVGSIPGRVVNINRETGSVSILAKDGLTIEILEVFSSEVFYNEEYHFEKPNSILKFSDTLNSGETICKKN